MKQVFFFRRLNAIRSLLCRRCPRYREEGWASRVFRTSVARGPLQCGPATSAFMCVSAGGREGETG